MKRFWLKLSFWAVINVAAAMFAVSAAFAGEISRHTRQDTGIRAAMDWCDAKGGSLTWKETKPFVLSEATDALQLQLTGNILLFTCKVPAAVGDPDWLLKWTAPTTRADGTALAVNQIAGYQISVDGDSWLMTANTEYVLKGVPVGTLVHLRTVDTSEPALLSESVTVTLQ